MSSGQSNDPLVPEAHAVEDVAKVVLNNNNKNRREGEGSIGGMFASVKFFIKAISSDWSLAGQQYLYAPEYTLFVR